MRVSQSLADIISGMPASVIQEKLPYWTHEELAEYDSKQDKTGYHVLAGLSHVSIPSARWSMESLQLRDSCGSTPLHVLASHGKAGALEAKFLTEKNLFAENEDGFTPYHWMVKTGQFARIPKEFQTLPDLLRPAKNGVTPLHMAARYSYLYTIPESLGFKKQSILETPTEDGLTVFHYIAMGGDWSGLPASVKTLKNFMKPDKEGVTSLHYAAEHKNLRTIPLEFITQSTVTWCAIKTQWSALHSAAADGSLQDIPPALLTPANLVIEDKTGATPIGLAIANDNLEQIPIFGTEAIAPLPPEEREAWINLCKRFKLPLPEILTEKWNHVHSAGDWQHL